jgi:hypothetical protein
MGTIKVSENWTNCLDYGSFTRADLYLPGAGFVPLKIDDVMDAEVQIIYWIDCLSGDCAIKVWCRKKMKTNKYLSAVCYQFHGNLMIHVPITGANYGRMYKNAIVGGINAATAAMSRNLSGVVNGVVGVMDALSEGPELKRSGDYSGSMAALAQRRPCLFLSRPIQHMPGNYNKYTGFPSFITYQLRRCTGYTMIESLIDNTISGATDTERDEIEKLLKDGVIFPPTEREEE